VREVIYINEGVKFVIPRLDRGIQDNIIIVKHLDPPIPGPDLALKIIIINVKV
jgi:hypothetical protein